MDSLTIVLIVGCSLLGLLALILLVRYLSLQAELRAFREQLNEIRTTDREQPIKVASFGASSVELAREINLLVEELRTAANRSAEEERRVRTIMAGVSHDFRTPLTAADGYLQMVKEAVDGMLTEGATQNTKPATDGKTTAEDPCEDIAVRTQELTEIRDYLCIVSERMRYLKTLSDEFFEVTYLDAKKSLPLETVRFDIVLSEVMMGQYAWIEASGIEPRMSIPEEQLTVRADRHYLERILENLFSNVRKYAKSRIELTATKTTANPTGSDGTDAASDPAGEGQICFILRNDMDESITLDVDHIFEPFYRAKARPGPGTGLGLYVVKELADAMAFQIEGRAEGEMFEIRLTMPRGDI